MKKYVVREGDTMWSIAEAAGVRPKLLMASNPQVKNPNQLRPGSIIVIPELTKGKEQPGKGSIGTVHPQPVGGLSGQGVQAGATSAVPQPTSASTTPGTQTMGTTPAVVPGGTVPPTAVPGGTVPPASGGALPPFFGFVWPHAVQPGETWSSIQQKYHVQMQHLQSLNPGLANRPLRPGDLLYIPGMVPPSELPGWATQGMPGMTGASTAGGPMAHGQLPAAQTAGVQGMPGQGMMQQPGTMPGVNGMPATGTPAQGTTPGPWPDPTLQDKASQWSEPYGPHQHNPYRYDDDFTENAWQESSSWDSVDGVVQGDWRLDANIQGAGVYQKFEATKPHANEISVYLGDPEENASKPDY